MQSHVFIFIKGRLDIHREEGNMTRKAETAVILHKLRHKKLEEEKNRFRRGHTRMPAQQRV